MTPDQIKSNWALFMECRHGKDLQNAPLPEAVLIFAEQISKLSSAMERESLYAIVKNEMIDRLEAAEKERDDAKAAAENIAWKLDYLRSKLETAENAQNDWLRANAPGGWIDNLRIENEALRAKVEAMERQEPVAWARKLAMGLPSFGCVTDLKYRPSNMPESAYMPLYALPGAKGEEK